MLHLFNRRRPVRRALLQAVFTLAVASTSQASASTTECLPVAGDRILAGDFAKVEPGFAVLDPTLDLGPAPLGSAERVFRPAELARLVQKYQVSATHSEPSEETPSSLAGVCFRRQTQTLSPQQLLPVLRAALDNDAPGNLQIDIVDFSRNTLPLGSLEFLRKNLSSTGLWHGRLLYGTGRSVPLWVQVRVTDLATGQALTMPRGIAAKTKPEVERGQSVQVEVARGGVHLEFEASAESSGHVGEAVVLRNLANGQRLRGIVTAEGKVTVRP